MLDFVKKYGYNVFSQNGEDGIIKECLNRIGELPKKAGHLNIAVEFGAADGVFCSNTRNLRNGNDGWGLAMYDINPSNLMTVYKKEITPDNVNDLPECNILSIDIDGADYEVWKAYKGKPDVVIIEINSSFPPDVEFYHPSKGSSFMTMVKLGWEKGYFLLCHTGNCVFILNEHKDKFPDITGPIENYFNKSWL